MLHCMTSNKLMLVACTLSISRFHFHLHFSYCSQMLSKDVDECVMLLLKELVRFQDRLYQKDPMKARMKRRIVMGLREVHKHLKLRKIKCVIISPNCERIQSKGTIRPDSWLSVWKLGILNVFFKFGPVQLSCSLCCYFKIQV